MKQCKRPGQVWLSHTEMLLLVYPFPFYSADKVIYIAISRKEVFQPHLPVRLPCYDLAPVISLALGRSCDGHELQALPTPMA